ncbi:CopG family transcriptional regulator [uncultured Enterovirga sp.]|uniref:type II toxin-antitoxin system RelB family antitoxin n=1 Tax=uncultured Enterovirga sp. TaxID=2026352 RepID=UPI0035CBB2C0
MLAVRIPPDLESRLDKAVEWVGRSKSELVVEAVLAHLEDLEDVHAADLALAEIAAGRSSTTTLEEVERELGLAD